MPSGTVRIVRPTSRGSESLPITTGISLQSQAMRRGVARADQLPVVQSGGTECGAQRVPVDGHCQVRGFPTGGGEIVGGAGPVAQFDQGVGVALGDAAGVGCAVGGGTAGGELLDQ